MTGTAPNVVTCSSRSVTLAAAVASTRLANVAQQQQHQAAICPSRVTGIVAAVVICNLQETLLAVSAMLPRARLPALAPEIPTRSLEIGTAQAVETFNSLAVIVADNAAPHAPKSSNSSSNRWV